MIAWTIHIHLASISNVLLFIILKLTMVIWQVYPKSHHCACLMHLQRNVQTIFKKNCLIYLIAKAYRLEDFYIHFNEIKVIDIVFAYYLIRIGFEH